MKKLLLVAVLMLFVQNASAFVFKDVEVNAKFDSISSVRVAKHDSGIPTLIVKGKGDLLIGDTNRKNTGIELIYFGEEYSTCADSANNAFTFLNLATSSSSTWNIIRQMATGEYGYITATKTVQVTINPATSFSVDCEINNGR